MDSLDVQFMCPCATSPPKWTVTSYVLGIVPLTPGFQRFSFRPQTDGLTFAEGTVPTYFGDIRARWEKKGEGLSVTITVPPGTTGEFVWRDQKRILSPGTHSF